MLDWLVPVDTDFGLLVVCGDRIGCRNLDMPVRYRYTPPDSGLQIG